MPAADRSPATPALPQGSISGLAEGKKHATISKKLRKGAMNV
jgi:hypothetical protein